MTNDKITLAVKLLEAHLETLAVLKKEETTDVAGHFGLVLVRQLPLL